MSQSATAPVDIARSRQPPAPAVEWPVVSLQEAGVVLIDCDHRTPPATPGGPYPYIAIPQIKEGRLELADARRITAKHFDEWTRKALPRANDVILSRRCNPGETAFVPPALECALGQNLVLLRAEGERVHPPFLRWWVRRAEWWDQIRTFLNVGAVFDSLKCADIPKFSLTLPPLSEQKAIADVLGSLDDKIELNRRMNRTLEQMAAAIFKAWFVDFEPVKAKAAGAKRFPSMPQSIFDALPTTFADSPLGPIPKGWLTSVVGDEVKVCGGSTPSTENPAYWEGGTHAWATPKDLSKLDSPILLETERCITEAGLGCISSGLLPKGTLRLSSRAPSGYLAIAETPTAINQGFIAMVCDKSVSAAWMLNWCRCNADEIVGRANGTTFLEISKSSFRPMPLVVPPKSILAAFDGVVGPLYQAVAANLRQSKTLAAIRDALLPKLLSGEIRVSAAVKAVEEVA